MAANARHLIPRVAVASLASPLEVGADRAPQAAAELADSIERAGCEVLRLGAVSNAEHAVAAGQHAVQWRAQSIAFAVASWFEDYLVTDLLEECAAPIVLWSLPGMETGALCGTQQLTSLLKRLEAPYRCVFGPVDSASALQATLDYIRAAALKYRLRRARVGLGGLPVRGMPDAVADWVAMKKTLGPRIVGIDLPELLQRAADMPVEQARVAWQRTTARAGVCKVNDDDGIDSMRVHAAVREQVEQHRLDALTVGCYPHLMGRVCLAASLLADEGIPLGCEGDVNGAVGQLMLTLLSGTPTHNTDWLEPLEDGTVVFTHCGSGSFSLAERRQAIELAPVRLMERGVCALFPARPGPVTLMNLVSRDGGYQMALLEGEAIPTDMVFPGNPLRVRFQRPTEHIIEWIHDEGIGHHWMAAYGRLGSVLRRWADIVGPGLRLLACEADERPAVHPPVHDGVPAPKYRRAAMKAPAFHS